MHGFGTAELARHLGMSEQVPCWIAATNEEVHRIMRANLHRAPMYNGNIHSAGPRYCPSIEDKVVRFAEREQHHLFLEPEGRTSPEIYVNGLSTSLPRDVQHEIVRRIAGLEDAEIVRYGYAVEYDYVPSGQVRDTLQTLSGSFPDGLSYAVAMETTEFVQDSIDEVVKTLGEAIVLVILVVFLFLQNLRATLIPSIAVVVSLVATFVGMILFGFSINLLALFGLVLAVGVVVGVAIVVVEGKFHSPTSNRKGDIK